RRVLCGFQWIGIYYNSHDSEQRIPDYDCRSKGVKERQRREDCVGLACIQQLPKLRDISDNVAVADYDALWFYGGSTCKKQNCFSVAAFLWNLQKTQEQTCGNQERHDPPENDLAFQLRHQFVQFQNAFRPWKIF